MKVFVFTHHAVCQAEDLGVENRVFANFDDAWSALAEWRDDEMFYIQREGWYVGTNQPNHFEAYEEGNYAYNHCEGFINEYEVE